MLLAVLGADPYILEVFILLQDRHAKSISNRVDPLKVMVLIGSLK